MSATKYIRPMNFGEIIGSMYRLYLKIMFPILLLNIIIVAMSWWILFVGAFVGPVLMMTSNAILGKPLKVLDSLRRGILSVSFLKIAIASIVYIVFIFALSFIASFGFLSDSGDVGDVTVAKITVFMLYAYIVLIPVWVFIPMIMLLEKKGLRASVKRSFQILRKNIFRILQMDIFIVAVFSVIAYVVSLPFYGDPSGFSPFMYGSVLAFFLPLLTGFSCLPYVFIYYEYRARHENYSEELLTQEMGYQPMEEMMTV